MPETLSPIVDRMVARIGTIANIGRVLKSSPFDRLDVADLIVGQTGESDRVLRVWWVQGPTMSADWLTGMSPQHISRTYTFEIHGIEAVAPAWEGDVREAGEDLQLLRDNAIAVCDVLDADDLGMGGLVFKAEPCQIQEEPVLAVFEIGEMAVPLDYVVIQKVVKTKPART